MKRKTLRIPKENKYHSKKVTWNGEVFDSQKEARRYAELKLLEKSGHISELKRQVRYELIPSQRETSTEVYTRGEKKGQFKKGKVIEKPCYYVADFEYIQDEKKVVEDTKGVRTKDYVIKRKLMLWVHKIKIVEV